MDAEALIWLVIMAIWFISNIVKQIGRMGKGKGQTAPQQRRQVPDAPQQRQMPPPVPPPVPASAPATEPHSGQNAGEDLLRDLMKQLGVDVQPVAPAEPLAPASEHRQSLGEHRQSLGETRQSLGETRGTASEHVGTLSEHRQAKSFSEQTESEHKWAEEEHSWTDGEHQGSPSEHAWGEVSSNAELSAPATLVSHRRLGRVKTNNVKRDVRQPKTLARALVLREILGPPVALRDEAGQP